MKTSFLTFCSCLGITLAQEPQLKTTDLPACCKPLPSNPLLSQKSLYHLQSEWVSDLGKKVPLRVLHGEPQIVALFFSSCEFACPVLVSDMKRLEGLLTQDELHQMGFLLVSFDPERDTPEALSAFRVRMNLTTKNWTLLTGQPKGIRELAAVLGVQYRKDAKGQYAHTNKLILLNSQGEVVMESVGLGQPVEPLVRKLRELLSNEATHKH